MGAMDYNRLSSARQKRSPENHPRPTTKPVVEYDTGAGQMTIEDPEMTLLAAAIKNRLPHMQECGGNGKCTTCRIRILDGLDHVSAPSRLEKRLAKTRGWEPSVRLACQTRITGPVKVERLIKTFSEVSRLQEELVRAGPGKEKQLAILFCDIRDFIPLVENQLAYDIVHILNRLFAVLGEPILANNGFINQGASPCAVWSTEGTLRPRRPHRAGSD